jgi:ribose-phosphate pyrophosphokinase
VHTISQQYDKEVIFLNKMRPENEKVEILTHEGDVQGRKILLIDDMITTGNTLVAAANTLHELGASEISAWATHGIFTNGAVERIASSDIKKLYVTNTLPHAVPQGNIEVVDIAPVIAKLIQ